MRINAMSRARVLTGLFGYAIRPLPPFHATAMLALTDGLFIMSASEK
jgi:hypothetical protein